MATNFKTLKEYFYPDNGRIAFVIHQCIFTRS